MKDKELRDIVADRHEQFREEIYKLKQMKCSVDSNKFQIDSINSTIFGSYDSNVGLIQIIKQLQIDNQQMILDYLGVEKIEEPSKTYLKKKSK